MEEISLGLAPSGASFEECYKANKGLIMKVARKVFARLLAMGAAVTLDDVEQEATIAMIKAHKGFNPELGFQFSTYYMRAAYYELNRFMKSFEQDIQVLHISSMQGLTDDTGESIDMESTIDGGHGSPEEILEAKQMLTDIEGELSPIAAKILELTVNPPECLLSEYNRTKGAETGRTDLSVSFVVQYLSRLTPLDSVGIKAAGREIAALKDRWL